ncbi:sporulation initiation inhibitor protein Soj [Anaerotignum neopropionicum]|uniref:Sporulation initiation inhibitor protein Soj n=1 Tax=Anaerotignum neopropionicum TaxID=36847 RepID=A0A136WJ40_9FIRM|nr:ParA family protein [Anaerotignum neopropionicum]KXL54562.1 sporulation initiation inhibitor protein Soj [Anaerotignum neopropionicum]
MSVIITLTNQKGGVGKTTTTATLITGLSLQEYKVLGIDLDPQGNLGFSLGLDIENTETIYDVFRGTAKIEDVIQTTEYGDIIPSNILLSGAELEFNRSGREYLLKEALQSVMDKYDYIIIDTPPALNILTVNAYVCSDHLIVPMVPEILSLLGVSQLKETTQTVKKFYNSKLNVLGLLLTKYNSRTNLANEVADLADEIAKQLNTSVFKARIRSGVAVAEAPAHGTCILLYSPRSKPTHDYIDFVEEVLIRCKAAKKKHPAK